VIPFIPPRTPEQHQAEIEWLARQPRWVQRTYVGAYSALFIAVIAIAAWAIWLSFSG